MTTLTSHNGAMPRYVAYVPMDDEWLPVVEVYEFRDAGQRVRSHITQEGVHMTALGLFPTRAEANEAAVRAWLGCHVDSGERKLSRQRHPAGGN